MGGGKGGGSSTTKSTVQQTNLPEYVRPQFERLLSRAEAESKREYDPYTGQRLANESGDVLESRKMVRDIAQTGIKGLPQAQAATALGIGRSAQGMQFGPAQFREFQGYTPSGFTGAGFNQYGYGPSFQYSPSGEYTASNVAKYMDPYVQNVLSEVEKGVRRDYAKGVTERAGQAVRSGAFGGSRAALVEEEARRGMEDRLARERATALSEAFTKGAGMFEADRAARMGLEELRASEGLKRETLGAGELARVQEAQAGQLRSVEAARAQEAARIQKSIADEQARVDAARAGERRSAEELGLKASELTTKQASQLAQLGELARSGDVEAARLLETIGKDQQAREQAAFDLAYQDFVRQRDYPREQLQFYSSILRGIPISPSTETDYITSYNPLQQAMGAGLAGLSLSRLMG